MNIAFPISYQHTSIQQNTSPQLLHLPSNELAFLYVDPSGLLQSSAAEVDSDSWTVTNIEESKKVLNETNITNLSLTTVPGVGIIGAYRTGDKHKILIHNYYEEDSVLRELLAYLAEPLRLSKRPEGVILNLAGEGSFVLEVTNNAKDTNPVWEVVNVPVDGSTPYVFKNLIKETEQWVFDVRISASVDTINQIYATDFSYVLLDDVPTTLQINTRINELIASHKSNINNPHKITPEQIGAYSKDEIDQFFLNYYTKSEIDNLLNP